MIVTGRGAVLFKSTTRGVRIYRQAVPRGENYLIGYVRMLSVGHPAVSNESLYIQGDMPDYDNRPLECTSSDLQGAFKTLIFVNNADDGVNIKDLIL